VANLAGIDGRIHEKVIDEVEGIPRRVNIRPTWPMSRFPQRFPQRTVKRIVEIRN
jgi:hypothetical protein